MAASPIAEFAESHGLKFAESADLPQQGATLTQASGKVEGAVSGTLPGGIEGTLARFTYVYKWTDSDNHSHEESRPSRWSSPRSPRASATCPTSASPARQQARRGAGGTDMAPIELEHVEALKGAAANAYRGTPSLAGAAALPGPDRMAGPLRPGLRLRTRQRRPLRRPRRLHRGAPPAGGALRRRRPPGEAIREESLEEVDTGGESEAARDPHYLDPGKEAALAAVQVDPPANGDRRAAGASAGHLLRNAAATCGRCAGPIRSRSSTCRRWRCRSCDRRR